MNEEEREDIELDIEAKYADKTEKEFLSRVTYAECLYILTPENKYCDKIKELSVLKICEIIKNYKKENEELKEDLKYVLNQTLGAFEKQWCIDWNFTEIREKYNLESEQIWKNYKN